MTCMERATQRSPRCVAVNKKTLKAHAEPDPEDESERAAPPPPLSRRSPWDKPGSDELGKSSLWVKVRSQICIIAKAAYAHARGVGSVHGKQLWHGSHALVSVCVCVSMRDCGPFRIRALRLHTCSSRPGALQLAHCIALQRLKLDAPHAPSGGWKLTLARPGGPHRPAGKSHWPSVQPTHCALGTDVNKIRNSLLWIRGFSKIQARQNAVRASTASTKELGDMNATTSTCES